LNCSYNYLPSLDVTANTALVEFWCNDNQLSNLNVSGLTNLNLLACGRNQLTTINVSSNTALTRFGCFQNPLTSLDVSINTALIDLYCQISQLTTLDLSTNIALKKLYCNENQLTSLQFGSNTALNELFCFNNQLTSLDVSGLTALRAFSCSYNPNLSCIKVADVAAANGNGGWVKDTFANYSLDCNLATTTEMFPKGILVFPNPAKALLTVQNNNHAPFEKIVISDLTGKIILTQTTNTTQINVEPLASGMYILEATSGEDKYSSKFVKE
jgi:hypothetical protein